MVADRGANAHARGGRPPAGLEAARSSSPATCSCRSPATTSRSLRSDASTRRSLAVEAASWPLVEAFGVERFFEETASCDVVLANEREAQVLTGDRRRRCRARARGAVPLRRGQAGRRGATLSPRGDSSRPPARPSEEVDPTGAGDAFDGVLLAALARGRHPRRRSRPRCQAGALVAASRADLAGGGRRVTLLPLRRGRAGGRRRTRRRRLGDERDRSGSAVPAQPRVHRADGTAIRDAGAVPAWIGVLDGAVRVGLDDAELERFADRGAATKVARRDVPVAVAARRLGATTVSATIWAAHRPGIAVVATGGIGGVHPGPRPDVSADLLELARTPVCWSCSGPKSIVDPAAHRGEARGARRGPRRVRRRPAPVLPRP